MDTITIIIPVYHNENSLRQTYIDLRKVLDDNSKKFKYELILVDDGSGDNSYEVMRLLAEEDKKIKLVKLSKNFGSYIAILAGLNFAEGDASTYLAADLQDPPELVAQMYDKWIEGNREAMIFAIRSSRDDPFFSRIYSYFFYKLFRAFVLPEYPKQGFDCFFINNEQRKLITGMDEKNSHLTAQMVWLGYKHIYIYYHRQKREYGKSKWTFFKKFKLAFDTFFGFSGRPLRIASLLGITISIIGFILSLYIIIKKLAFDTPLFGVPSLMVALLVLGGLILLSIGILGEYMWRNFDAARKRPTFIVEKTFNC